MICNNHSDNESAYFCSFGMLKSFDFSKHYALYFDIRNHMIDRDFHVLVAGRMKEEQQQPQQLANQVCFR